jgi:S1-C subfamily serine protease
MTDDTTPGSARDPNPDPEPAQPDAPIFDPLEPARADALLPVPEQQGPRPATAAADPAVNPDPLDDTQPVEVPRYAPTPDPRPDTRWAWAQPDPAAAAGSTGGAADRWFSPSPAGSRPDDPAHEGGEPSTVRAADGFAEPVPAPTATMPVKTRRGGAGLGTIAIVSLLSAVIASAGTVFALERAGAFDQAAMPASTAGSGQAAGASVPVTIDESSAVIDAAARTSPAVVKITTEGQSTDPFGTVPSEGVGSGFIYDPDGWIVTNRHVVTGADTLKVELPDGRVFDGTVYGTDTLTDLAIVKVEAADLPFAGLGSSDGLKIGQLVVAIGSPLGTYSFSVTSGIVSGQGRDIVVDDGTSRITNLIQTDAAINRGNSGGPLTDATGAVVGINTAVADDSSGIGFAIPIDIARPIMDQALAGVPLSRPWIGIRFLTLDLQLQKELGLPVAEGALVTNQGGTGSAIVPGSPAATAGLLDNDIVIAIDDQKLDQLHPLDATLVQFAPGDTVTLDVLRDGESIRLTLTLGTRPENT